MRRDRPADVLLARVRVLAPGARSFLITSARRSASVMTIATEFAASLQSSGHAIELVNLTAHGDRGPADAEAEDPASAGAPLARTLTIGEGDSARTVIAAVPGVVVLASDGILERGMPFTLAGAVDAVIVVATRGETRREEIPRAARTIADARGVLLVVAYRE